jgi:hypothetical protein
VKKVTIVVSDSFAAGVWESVERNAKEVASWPEWKKLGSGLLDVAGNATPKNLPDQFEAGKPDQQRLLPR